MSPEDDWYRPLQSSEHGTEWGAVIHRLLEAAMRDHARDLRSLAVAACETEGLSLSRVEDVLATIEAVRHSQLWRRATARGNVLVEIPFHLWQPKNISESSCDTLLRGVIDLAFQEPDGWVIVDYKTDAVSHQDRSKLVRLYRRQVAMYGNAWSQLTEEPVIETGLYFTHLQQYVSI